MDNSYKSWTKKEEQELMTLYKVKNLSILTTFLYM
jgi:hypothetical protein